MGRRIALLIGNQTFPTESKLEPLRGPANDVEALAGVLADPALGGFEVQSIVDRPHYEILRAIVETLQSAEASDFVLIYYSGHGKLSPTGKLHLAAADTDAKALQATTVAAWSLHEAVSDSRCQQIVLLLDCCFSGAVSTGLKGDLNSQLAAVQNAAGFFILTASTDVQKASESELELSGKVMGRFTAALVDGIRSGDAARPLSGEVFLSDLKAHLERTLRGSTPQFFAHRGSGDPLISHSSQLMLDLGALADLNDAAWYRRVGAVRYCASILAKDAPHESRAVRAALAARLALERDVKVRQAIDSALGVDDDGTLDPNRAKILKGVAHASRTIRMTLGPTGRSVLLGKQGAAARLIRNGTTIIKRIERSDPFERMGVQLMQELAAATSDAGGGAKTAIVLAQAIIDGSTVALATGCNAMGLKHGIDVGVERVIADIEANAIKNPSNTELAQMISLSAYGDSSVVEVIVRAYDQVGRNGVIVTEETEMAETEIDVVEGLRFNGGYLSPYFVTDAEKLVTELEDSYLLIHEKKISALQPLLPVLEAVVQTGRPLLIIAEDVEGEALATLVTNKIRGGLKVAAVKAPGFGDRRKAMLEDIAILTQGQMISAGLGIKLESVTLQMLGRAKSIRIDKESTIIIDWYGERSGIDDHIVEIRKYAEEINGDFVPGTRQKRLAKLTEGVAVIRVGGSNRAEVKLRRDQIDESLRVMTAALDGGIVLGGGVSLLRSARALDGVHGANSDQEAGLGILRQALQAPLRQIAENTGARGADIVAEVMAATSMNYGFDALAKRCTDLHLAGILDPTKAVCAALRAAASTAGVLTTTDIALFDASSPTENNAAAF